MNTFAAVPCAVLVLVLIVAAAPAQASEELAKQKACLTCHAMDKKVVGPSFKDIAEKYKAEKDGDKKLAAKIRAGGSGVWGQIPMPANAAVNEAEALILAKWSLNPK